MKVKTFRILMIGIMLLILGTTVAIAVSYFSRPAECTAAPDVIIKYEQPAVASRDEKVIHDQLYPPLNRMSKADDTYRLVGYLTSHAEIQDAGGNNWKLFARQKDRHTSDFYIIPANNNYDIKIPLDNNTTVERLRDLYSIPNELHFKNPMLNEGTYVFTELPKSDFSSIKYL